MKNRRTTQGNNLNLLLFVKKKWRATESYSI